MPSAQDAGRLHALGLHAPDDPMFPVETVRTCDVCGCTDDEACVDDFGPCHWVAENLCSRCARLHGLDE